MKALTIGAREAIRYLKLGREGKEIPRGAIFAAEGTRSFVGGTVRGKTKLKKLKKGEKSEEEI